MAPRLTSEFKKKASDFMLNKASQIILSKFDDNNKYNSTINVEYDTNVIEIRRNCYPDTLLPYYEDYLISFETIIQNQKIESKFYLEWKNDKIYTQLIPANTCWDHVSGLSSKRIIK